MTWQEAQCPRCGWWNWVGRKACRNKSCASHADALSRSQPSDASGEVRS